MSSPSRAARRSACGVGPDTPVGPGDETTVVLFEPESPHDPSASPSPSIAIESIEIRGMAAILARRRG